MEILHHHELDAEGRLRNAFAPELAADVAADDVVLALGRVPVEADAPLGVPCERAGDCLSPRSLEEAVLGAAAARCVVA